jgi:fructokinase
MLPDGPQLGGAPLNIAYRLCCLGDRGLLVTRVGRDEYGQLAILRMAELGMDTSLVQSDDQRPTGRVEVELDALGRPEFTIASDVAYDGIEVTYELMEAVQGVDCVCFGTLVQRTAGSRTTLQRLLAVVPGVPRFLDLNLRSDCYTWTTVEEALRDATLLKLNEDEARRLAFGCELAAEPLPELCDALIDRWNLTACAVTLGERGAFAATADGTRAYEPGYEVPVVDTCGSGDAFSAGFLHAYLRGERLAACCRLGGLMGALVATQAGATEPLAPVVLDQFVAARMPRTRDERLTPFEG